ncbi:DUF2924 domain-containing protein [Wolbachia endosymbiont of Folsomia candida]|uniref:DUF2924 domain-containing protein n=1 Tax=Wolbachia endosymbiont of Folsomia candida TaxID=169402 RepID=UPI000A80DEEA|nr:DUF2924 domain-containing protein [Wolbachia endosymbiont of Folsomia candida]APR98550.1 DUF2924 domain-containing protein [Wolbachia endosymbiont of Folsomia candida]APR98956.1 DUF2924 domain-containing protein [Wolbachia endosymbiont of Folsomia candida]
MNASVEKEVLSLSSKTSQELRKMYETASKGKAPPYRREYFIRWISHWLQANAFGELSEKAAKKLDYLAEQMKEGKKVSSENPLMAVGTKIIKEYHGEKHEVTVSGKKLFIYKGQPYKSLSAIANKITGTRWNGLVFFGVKNVKTN